MCKVSILVFCEVSSNVEVVWLVGFVDCADTRDITAVNIMVEDGIGMCMSDKEFPVRPCWEEYTHFWVSQ